MLWISIRNPRQSQELTHASGPIDFGRGAAQSGIVRVVLDDGFASRDHLRVEGGGDGKARLCNLSTKYAITLQDGAVLAPSTERTLALPVVARVGDTEIAIHARAAPSSEATVDWPAGAPTVPEAKVAEEIAADGYQAITPVRSADGMRSFGPLIGGDGKSMPVEAMAQWMETVLALQRSDSGPTELYQQTAQALVRMIGLDVGLVLLWNERTSWKVVARAARDVGLDTGHSTGVGREFSRTVLQQVLADKQTFFQDLGKMRSQESLRSVDAVVVSPVFGLNDEVVGALYGLRRPSAQHKGCRVQPVEAQLVQLLAAAVGANLARTSATRTRARFEQFFSADLVRELERDPGLLEGRAHEVTILMSDLRGFSALSERLGPEQTCQLIRDVMERLSECIAQQGGVIVSYLGDGILAMWNAPTAQDDHAGRAGRAALAMLRELPALNERWAAVVGHPLAVGIGINTGPAQVGNTGSSRKFMYGPLGNTVNLASRVEGATKHFKVPILVTGPTRARLGPGFATRRLGQVRVVGIQNVVELHELHGETAEPAWLSFRDTYEAALGMFERRQWVTACQVLLPLMDRGAGGYDPAALKLMKRAWACLEGPSEEFDPVLEMSSK